MKPMFNRAPLTQNTLAPLPLGSIRPEGWLGDQLRVQADNLTGPLHDQWPDVGDDCAWLGGSGDGWERAPYYLDGLVAEAKEKGYVTTMFGRRRPIPELSSSNFMQRSFGERIAMNSPIQGTAADIIKIAMNRVHDRLLAEGLKSRLILTVHDELLVETAVEEEQEVRKILAEEMHGAAQLSVMLEIDVHAGSDWYQAK